MRSAIVHEEYAPSWASEGNARPRAKCGQGGGVDDVDDDNDNHEEHVSRQGHRECSEVTPTAHAFTRIPGPRPRTLTYSLRHHPCISACGPSCLLSARAYALAFAGDFMDGQSVAFGGIEQLANELAAIKDVDLVATGEGGLSPLIGLSFFLGPFHLLCGEHMAVGT